jgi:hypothetical protein
MRRNTAKRILVGLTVASISGFAPMILSSATSASAFGVQATAPIQKGNGDCGRNLRSLPVLGEVIFTRTGNEVYVTVSMSNAPANQSFEASLWTGSCDEIGSGGSFTTNSHGSGGIAFSVAVSSGETRFFGTVYNESTDYYNDTPIVSVP